MDAERWKGLVRRAFSKDKGIKLVVLLGLCGVLLIYLSGLFGGKKEKNPDAGTQEAPGTEAYGERLEEDLCRVVRAMTGEESPTVLVTLEDRGTSVYASDETANSRAGEDETSGERETVHVILKDADGAQHALTVTEIQPEIKGVVIVSRYAGDPVIREKLVDAVRTALDVSSAKVCVTDTG